MLVRVRVLEREGRQPELKISTFKEKVNLIFTHFLARVRLPEREGKAAGAENEHL